MYYQSWSKSDDLGEPLKQMYNIKEMFYELLEIACFKLIENVYVELC